MYNIFFWTINDDLGIDPPNFNEEDVLRSVWAINRAFNQFNIFFKLKGFDNYSWNECDYKYGKSLSSIIFRSDQLGFVEPNSFNVYVPYTLNSGGGQASFYGTRIAMNVNSFINYQNSIIHEIGHSLGIHHADGEGDYGTSQTTDCEHVTRDPYLLDQNGDPILDGNGNPIVNPDYNADEKGDYVIDTPAQPRFGVIDDFDPNCNYIGDGLDCIGVSYEINPNDIKNYMANGTYSFAISGCRDQFTIGQGIRMRESIAFTNIPYLAAAETSIDALYEPYRGVYYTSGPVDLSEDYMVLFQPGFDYEFRACSCDNQDNLDCSEPCDFSTTSFQNNHTLIASWDKDDFHHYPLITHPNHTAIIIKQLDQYGPRKCWDNWNKASIGGSLTTFNDGIINSNVTIQPKDSLQINDENLINNLPSGLYKLDENYNDGTTRQRVISKENE